jgi:hypothetical protein
MGIYDQRTKPAYSGLINKDYAKNQYILDWWTPDHDKLIEDLIPQYQWYWYWKIRKPVVNITDKEILDNWIEIDPLCKQYLWGNIIMWFAEARADDINLTRKIRKPLWKLCELCGNRFIENSLPLPLAERLGIDRLDFCAPCLKETLLSNTGTDDVSADQVIEYLKGLFKLTGVLPKGSYYFGHHDLLSMSYKERLRFLKLLKHRPSTARVNELYNSWANALQEANLVGDYVLETPRGTHTTAIDGHLCLSIGEKTIDDFLYEHGIDHEKEPPYPDCNYRADFKVGDTIIEYFGMIGNPEYDERMKEKFSICKDKNIKLIALYPKDLKDVKSLKKKLIVLIE